MQEKLMGLKNEALAMILGAESAVELEEIRIQFLGKKGKLTLLLKEIPHLGKEERPIVGALINEVKKSIEEGLEEKNSGLGATSVSEKDWIDVTLPGQRPPEGHLHLLTQAIEEITSTFEKIGFTRRRYPEIEWDWYAFGSLNMPSGHPARDEWETFFIDEKPHPKLGQMVLTPHTSSGQLREMEQNEPPIRMINISKCYRRQYDVSHTPMFHQFEGLLIDKGIAITHLKGILDYFVREFFGPKRKSRIRPFHFRFTEPSFEVDVTCDVCLGKGCKLCKEGWLELGGAGMVHPQVLKNGGINPQVYTGFAFGWGVERTYLMKEGLKIGDVRLLYDNDIRFLEQF
ncbi:phenylalanine--tRNA ligase subunit alpha [Candidatus Microgenomates bacterium]|nr:phenylalanine--tRNA ligase subunit alpha [Candidatus Microgenomates bacterium]